MTTQVSNEVKNFVLITYAKTKYFITEKQYTTILSIGQGKIIKSGEFTINTSTIAEILPVEDYYQNNPKERPQHTNYSFERPKYTPETKMTKVRYLRALNGMLKGVKKYIRQSGNPSEWSLKKEEELTRRIEIAKDMSEKEIFEVDIAKDVLKEIK